MNYCVRYYMGEGQVAAIRFSVFSERPTTAEVIQAAAGALWLNNFPPGEGIFGVYEHDDPTKFLWLPVHHI